MYLFLFLDSEVCSRQIVFNFSESSVKVCHGSFVEGEYSNVDLSSLEKRNQGFNYQDLKKYSEALVKELRSASGIKVLKGKLLNAKVFSICDGYVIELVLLLKETYVIVVEKQENRIKLWLCTHKNTIIIPVHCDERSLSNIKTVLDKYIVNVILLGGSDIEELFYSKDVGVYTYHTDCKANLYLPGK